MRNPIRLKNLNARFLPFYLFGLGVIILFPPRPIGFIVAAPFLILGLLLRTWGAGHLVKNDVLTYTGPYAHLRHPLYAGTILVATGFAVLFGGWVSLVLIAAIWPWFALSYFPRKERSEAARLESLYGNEFNQYRQAVPALWPRRLAWSPASANSTKAEPAPRWDLDRYSENNELGTLLAILAGVVLIAIRTFWVTL